MPYPSYVTNAAPAVQYLRAVQCAKVDIAGFTTLNSLPHEVVTAIGAKWGGVAIHVNEKTVKVDLSEGSEHAVGLSILKNVAVVLESSYAAPGLIAGDATKAAAQTAAYVALNPEFDVNGREVHKACPGLAEAPTLSGLRICTSPSESGLSEPGVVTIHRTDVWRESYNATALEVVCLRTDNRQCVRLDRVGQNQYAVRVDAEPTYIHAKDAGIRDQLLPPPGSRLSLPQRILNFLAELFRRHEIEFRTADLKDLGLVADTAPPEMPFPPADAPVRNGEQKPHVGSHFVNGTRQYQSTELAAEAIRGAVSILTSNGSSRDRQLHVLGRLVDGVAKVHERDDAKCSEALAVLADSISRLRPDVREEAYFMLAKKCADLRLNVRSVAVQCLVRELRALDPTAKRRAVECLVAMRANLERAELCGVDLRWLNLRSINLCGANLKGANLAMADLTGTNLAGAHLEGADLSKANLKSATLTNAHLEKADLRIARLLLADLDGANLTGAHLAWVNLYGAKLHMAVLPLSKEVFFSREVGMEFPQVIFAPPTWDLTDVDQRDFVFNHLSNTESGSILTNIHNRLTGEQRIQQMVAAIGALRDAARVGIDVSDVHDATIAFLNDHPEYLEEHSIRSFEAEQLCPALFQKYQTTIFSDAATIRLMLEYAQTQLAKSGAFTWVKSNSFSLLQLVEAAGQHEELRAKAKEVRVAYLKVLPKTLQQFVRQSAESMDEDPLSYFPLIDSKAKVCLLMTSAAFTSCMRKAGEEGDEMSHVFVMTDWERLPKGTSLRNKEFYPMFNTKHLEEFSVLHAQSMAREEQNSVLRIVECVVPRKHISGYLLGREGVVSNWTGSEIQKELKAFIHPMVGRAPDDAVGIENFSQARLSDDKLKQLLREAESVHGVMDNAAKAFFLRSHAASLAYASSSYMFGVELDSPEALRVLVVAMLNHADDLDPGADGFSKHDLATYREKLLTYDHARVLTCTAVLSRTLKTHLKVRMEGDARLGQIYALALPGKWGV